VTYAGASYVRRIATDAALGLAKAVVWYGTAGGVVFIRIAGFSVTERVLHAYHPHLVQALVRMVVSSSSLADGGARRIDLVWRPRDASPPS
jgi:hypothetical protein